MTDLNPDIQNTGLVTKAISGFYTVRREDGSHVVCKLPGKLKQAWKQTDIVAVGDRVDFEPIEGDEENGLITEVHPRTNALARIRPSAHARQLQTDREQVLVANVDQIVFVNSLRKPVTNLRKLDRMLVVAEQQQIPAILCVNKIDLGSVAEAEEIFKVYLDLGYPMICTSTFTGEGIEALAAQLSGRISALSGSSGVGKSSLLNAIQPNLGLKVGEVSRATTKGMHTTRYAELIPLEIGGFVADTPGIRGWALYDIRPDELDAYFREIAQYVPDCQFSNCTHRHEPGCAVLAAVADGKITEARYDSYLRLREEHDQLFDAAYRSGKKATKV